MKTRPAAVHGGSGFGQSREPAFRPAGASTEIGCRCSSGRRAILPASRWVCAALAALLVLLLSVGGAKANGGTTVLSRAAAGPYEVTVTIAPGPLRVGPNDMSVLVERASSGEIILDAVVAITAEPVGRPGSGDRFSATHAQASNPLLYAANVSLRSAGPWQFTIDVSSTDGPGELQFDMNASAAALGLTPSEWAITGAAGAAAVWLLLRARARRRSRRRRPDR